MLMILAAISLAAQPTEAEAAVLACTQVADDRARLACFDAAVRTLEVAAEEKEERAAEAAVAAFGKQERASGRETLEELTLAVTDVSLDRNGVATFTLENGQIWRQTSRSSQPIHSGQMSHIETATITSAAMGSHRMRLEPLGRSFKVKRIQ